METTGGYSYWLNVKNERHNISIQNMVKAVLIYSNQRSKIFFCASDTSAESHRCKIHNGLYNRLPNFSWYGKNPSIHELRLL